MLTVLIAKVNTAELETTWMWEHEDLRSRFRLSVDSRPLKGSRISLSYIADIAKHCTIGRSSLILRHMPARLAPEIPPSTAPATAMESGR